MKFPEQVPTITEVQTAIRELLDAGADARADAAEALLCSAIVCQRPNDRANLLREALDVTR